METELLDLLEKTGARVHGRRADCPSCKRRRSVSFDASRGVFCCHGIDCDFSGSLATLRQRLGIEREWLPRGEYIRQRRKRERGREAARRLYAVVQGRRLELLDELHHLGSLELKVHRAGPDHPATWDGLALVYRERSRVESELDFLETATARELVFHLS